MNREIKFRAWIKDRDLPEGNMTNVADNLFVSFRGEVCIENVDGKLICYDEDKVELMQYTGLKDKNEQEIYEGDIIQTSEGQIELVKWDDNKRYAAFYPFMPIFSTYLDSTEVLGNKFEDPDLMERVN